MTSTKAKGAELELRAKKELEAAGYMVERAKPAIRWIPAKMLPFPLRRGRKGFELVPIIKSYDFWGVFDLIAIGQAGIRLIQVTGRGGDNTKKKPIEELGGKFPGCSLEVWRWRGGRQTKLSRVPRGWLKEKLKSSEMKIFNERLQHIGDTTVYQWVELPGA